MGYTHYYSYKFADPRWPEVFGRTALDAKTIIEAVAKLTPPIEIVREYDRPTDPPEITEGGIYFNGPGDLGHETFVIDAQPWWVDFAPDDPDPEYQERYAAYAKYCAVRSEESGGAEWGFCKTARKPYDLVVCSVLLRLAVHGGDRVTGRRDGWWDEEWLNGAWPPDGVNIGARGFVATLFPDDPVVDLGKQWAAAENAALS